MKVITHFQNKFPPGNWIKNHQEPQKTIENRLMTRRSKMYFCTWWLKTGRHERAVQFSLQLHFLFEVIVRLKMELTKERGVWFSRVLGGVCDSQGSRETDTSNTLRSQKLYLGSHNYIKKQTKLKRKLIKYSVEINYHSQDSICKINRADVMEVNDLILLDRFGSISIFLTRLRFKGLRHR